MYSVQQLIFDCMSYLKAFEAADAAWYAAATEKANREVEILKSTGFDVWLHRPAMNVKAADNVVARLQRRYRVQGLECAIAGRPGAYVFLGRRAAQTSHI